MRYPEPMDTIHFAFARGFGGALTPLRGKLPQLDAWQTQPLVDEPTVRGWVEEQAFNLGLRTGRASGLFVIDDDRPQHGLEPFDAPPTDLIARSPTGGLHYYYRAPDSCPGNSASRIAPYVDTRGEGGQVVYPGSSHPVTRTPYRWVRTGEPGTLPPEILALLREPEPARPQPQRPAPTPRGTGYADAALHREVHAVRTAPEGERNDRLNRAAFSLGQLVAGGALSRATVEAELTEAARLAGLDEREIPGTIRSGLDAGADKPRTAPEPRASVRTAAAPRPAEPASTERVDVLIPGSHVLPPDGEYREQGTDRFSDLVLATLPPGTLYRRAGIVGQVINDGFATVGPDLLRSIVDENMRLGAGKENREPDVDGAPVYAIQYRPCQRDHAVCVLAYAERRGQIRELKHLATHPVVVGSQFTSARPGWNGDHGVFLAVDHVPEPLPLETSRAVLEDLVCDFPFQTPADRANYFGLMLTPLLRPAIQEPVPMHLINSPIERSGKTKLAEIVLGCTILGHPTPAMQLGEREEEREKRIMATLVEGRTVLHLDNLTEFLGSAALASLLTSANYVGRILGSTQNRTLPNTLTVVGTGNNVHATGEIAKRIVPIRLLPATESPESRQDYRHPLLREYVESQRHRVMGALLGLIEAWRIAGRPLAGVGFGGFERWAAVMGGLMRTAGYPEWLGNLAEWRGSADDFTSEVNALCKSWHDRYGSEWVPAGDVYGLSIDLGLFGFLEKAKTERGRRTSFGMRVLNRICGRTVLGGLTVESDSVGAARKVRLVRLE